MKELDRTLNELIAIRNTWLNYISKWEFEISYGNNKHIRKLKEYKNKLIKISEAISQKTNNQPRLI